MARPSNPLSKLSRQELIWFTGLIKDACRERLEKNLVSQAFEDRLYQRGPVAERLDPRPFLKIWEPRYRKFLEVASEMHSLLETADAKSAVESLREQFDPSSTSVKRREPRSAPAIMELDGANPRRKSRTR